MPFAYRLPGLLGLIAALTLVAPTEWSGSRPALAADTLMDTLVTTEWLGQHLEDPGLVVLDCTVLVELDEGGGNGQKESDAEDEQYALVWVVLLLLLFSLALVWIYGRRRREKAEQIHLTE